MLCISACYIGRDYFVGLEFVCGGGGEGGGGEEVAEGVIPGKAGFFLGGGEDFTIFFVGGWGKVGGYCKNQGKNLLLLY